MKPNQIPTSAVKYILFQRTGYLLSVNSLLLRALRRACPFITYNFMVGLEAKLRPQKIIDMYFADMKREYESLKEFLPADCSRILDIGCGVAGIDVYLNRHYLDKGVEFCLLDRSQTDEKVYYLYEAKGAFYNSLDLARATLVNNGVDEGNVHLIEATENNEINIDENVDLVVSLISWGFHYPVSTYLDRAYDVLNKGGALILDIRKGTDGLDLIAERFGEYRKIYDAKKYARICATK